MDGKKENPPKLTPAELAALAQQNSRVLETSLAARLHAPPLGRPAVPAMKPKRSLGEPEGSGLGDKKAKPSPRELPPPSLQKPRTQEIAEFLSHQDVEMTASMRMQPSAALRTGMSGASLPRVGSEKRPFGDVNNVPTKPVADVPMLDERKNPFWFIAKIRRAPSSLEFVYLNRVRAGDREPYNPYNLEIVPHSDIHPNDYYTMSASGVTHFLDGDTDFTPLAKWEREYKSFHKMLAVPFFQKYLIWKAFSMWKRWIRVKKHSTCQEFLEGNLFILNPDLRKSALDVRRQCVRIGTLKMFKNIKGQTLTLDKFMDIQQTQKDSTSRELGSLSTAIHDSVSDGCHSAMQRVGFGAEKFKELTDQPTAGGGGSGVSPMGYDGSPSPAGAGGRADSISPDRQPSPTKRRSSASLIAQKAAAAAEDPFRMTYTELSARRAQCKRLTNFIRLADYLVVDSLQHLALSTVNEMLNDFSYLANLQPQAALPPPPSSDQSMSDGAPTAPIVPPTPAPLFRTELLFKDDSLIFVPNADAFEDKTDNLLTSYVHIVQEPSRLQKMEDFREYIEPAISDRRDQTEIGEGPDIAAMIEENQEFRKISSKIKERLTTSFADVEKYGKIFEHFRRMFLENRKMDAKKFKEENLPLDFYKDAIAKYKSEHEEVDAMAVSNDISLFRVDSARLKETLIPSPLRCLKDIQDLLPILAESKNTSLFAEVNESLARLRSTPTTVRKYVEYLAFVEDLQKRMERLEAGLFDVSQYYNFMDEQKIKIPQGESQAFSLGTQSMFKQLKQVLFLTEEAKEENMTKFRSTLGEKFEKVRGSVQDVSKRAQNKLIASEETSVEEAIQYLEGLQADVEKLRKKHKNYSDFKDSLSAHALNPVEELDAVASDVSLKYKLWSSIRDWTALTAKWNLEKFDGVDVESINMDVQKFSKVVMMVTKELIGNPVVLKLRNMVDEFKLTLPVVTNLRTILDLKFPGAAGLKDRHWTEIEQAIGKPITKDDSFTLGLLIELKVMDCKDEIALISQIATQESALLDLLEKVKTAWEAQTFNVLPYKDYRDMYMIGAVDDIVVQLEDSQATISTILSSRYVAPIKKMVEEWETWLKTMSDCLDEWLVCQRQWMYLEAIFSAGDMQTNLKDAFDMFRVVDKFFRDLMKRTKELPSCKRCLLLPGLVEKLQTHNANLEIVQKKIEQFLDNKRDTFSRFYFLSNDDLLDILANSRNPAAVLPHLMKCFDNIKSLTFDKDGVAVTNIVSSEGEQIATSKTMRARGPPEEWLQLLERDMVNQLKAFTKAAVNDYPIKGAPAGANRKKTFEEWIMAHCSQVVLTVFQIYWCKYVQDIFVKGLGERGLLAFKEESIQQLNRLAALTRQQLTPLQRGMLGALITIAVHARDLVDEMIADKVARVTDFGWFKQLKYTWEEKEDDCFVRQTNASFRYGYEYLGCQPRLVITPLTDRVYMTLTGALHLKLGGAPAGPAGTGKTETTKDLAKALARQCVVFNCSDGVTYMMMAKFFTGLVRTGAWACFDEFNRINVEVLSVIASQILCIRNALLQNLQTFRFEGKDTPLRPTCGVFITMNPGYAGRTELPDNLKALFRPVAVMIPDFRLIAEVVLFSEGFENAKPLSRKMVQLYKLSSEQLSSQDHYDFGMRAVKSVLVMAGTLKRANPTINEDLTLIRAMRDSNIPKFVAEDVPLFQGILSDLFPGVVLPEQDYGELQIELEAELKSRNLQVIPRFLTKIIQLYDTLLVRHGVMLVGPTGGGKSINRQVLASAMSSLRKKGSHNQTFQAVQEFVLNPKSITYGELYGAVNVLTNEWTDGIVPMITRKCVVDTTPDKKWIIFDGPVDTLWIESMNSVLDDSKLLCLDNGERIKLSNTTFMMFEVQDLSVASPATVSRCGMVFMDPSDLGWKPVVQTWINSGLPMEFPRDLKDHLHEHFLNHVDNALTFVRKQCVIEMPTVDLNMVTSLCDLFRALIVTNNFKFPGTSTPEATQESKRIVDLLFFFSLVWSIGGNVNTTSQEKFDGFARDEFDGVVPIPGFGTVYDYFVDFDQKRFRMWNEIIPEYKYTKSVPYFQILVPTIDTVRYSYLLKTLVQVNKPVLFNGPTGVGKSVIIANCLTAEGEKMATDLVTLQFSAQTSSGRTQEMIETKLEKRRKNIIGPPVGRKIALFVDDLNMPQLEKFGAQPPVELLNQIIGAGGFYDRKKLFWKEIEAVTFVAACGPPGGGRNNVTQRLLRLFHMLAIPNLSDDSMKKIFGSIVDGFLEPFNSEVRPLGKGMVNAGVELYNRIIADLRPTPARSHYTFNLRDLSKVFQGILQIQPRSASQPPTMMRLWIHECMRCFHDRLINQEDRRYFTELLVELVKRHFGSGSSHEELFEQNTIMFGDFLRMGLAAEDRMYEEVTDSRKLPKLLDDYLDEYNLSATKQMNLVFFKDAIAHAARLVRVIRQPRGNALLVGVGGSGKQSLTRLAASIAEYKCFQIELAKGYDITNFREDLKKLYNIAGVERKQVVFLFSDTQIVNESFLEDINNILNSGEVPNLFASDEKDKIINDVRQVCRELGLPETKDAVYSFFINTVRDNLHIVLCMSPVGDNFRNRCRMFPSLVNCCTIDWFDEWPHDALLSVAKRFLESVEIESEDLKTLIAEMCVEIHSSVAEFAESFYQELRRRFYVTPTSYLEFINLYSGMLSEKRKELGQARDRLLNGLQKLKETNEQVDGMQKELEQLQPILAAKTKETAEQEVRVQADREKANQVKVLVSEEEALVNEKTVEAEAIAEDAKRDLDEALPALDAAVKALDGINKQDITVIKSFAKPPELVQKVMEAVLVLFGNLKPDWAAAKAMLGDAEFLKKCVDFPKDNIPANRISALQKYLNDPDFTPDKVKDSSSAAMSLCMWVRAMDTYSRVAKTVAPKRAKLQAAETQLAEMKAKLKEKQDKLAQVMSELNELERLLERTIQEKEDLNYKTELSAARLARASILTNSLADEAVRWAQTVSSIEEQIGSLPGNVFLAAASVAYCGPFTAQYRQSLASQWVQKTKEKGIPVSDSFSLISVLSNPVQVRQWVIWSLPTDDLSTENGILVTRSRRWPLMIDPQGQANKWIKNMESKHGLKVIKLTDHNYQRTLENAIRVGAPVLLEDVGEVLDPALEPLLQKQIYKQGLRTLIRLGDTDVDYDPNFRFYITTKLSNPHYLPEVCIKVTLINFTVTAKGLEDQLLGEVVRRERLDLEEKKDSLVVSVAADKKQLKDIEDLILNQLENVKGNILDEQSLIDSLNESKVKSIKIAQRVKDSEETEATINITRDGYRPIAIRGSILYFVIADLALIDPMYQYSLEYFKALFNKVIENAPKSDDLATRISILLSAITETVYKNVCRGLFEKDKTIFSFLICVQILRQSGDISNMEWNFLLRAGSLVSTDSASSNPDRTWLTEMMWSLICAADKHIPALKGLAGDVSGNLRAWKIFMESSEPHKTPLPVGGPSGIDWNTKLTTFQKMLILKCFREEKLLFSVSDFVVEHLGRTFVESLPFDLEEAIKDIAPSTPIIFVLSQGADPTEALQRFARDKRGFGDRLHIISLGQGQGKNAKDLIERGKKNGNWVLLQNCHLALSFMTDLEKIVAEFSVATTVLHPDFRLWLTSMPSKDFPIPILQNGVKLTNEPPKGLRANLLRSYNQTSEEYFTSLDESPAPFSECTKAHAFKKLLFGLCFFHAIIQERKKFGPLGWTVSYEFNDSDLEVSKISLRMFLDEQPELPWDSLRYVVGEIHYGGRVTDTWDRRCLKSILNAFFKTDILSDAHAFSESGVYRAPPEGPLSSYMEYIQSLDLTDPPEIFGMHENANIAFQKQETDRMLGTVLSMQPRTTSVGSGLSSEDIVMQLAQDILANLPDNLTKDEAGPTTFKVMENGLMHSLSTVLSHEMVKFNKLLNVMRRSLSELQKAIKGLVVLSAALDKMLYSLLNNTVPEMWADVAYPSLKPLGSWVKDLHQRVKFLRNWLVHGQPNVFWMSGFFFPQGFLTGVLQTYARKHRDPIDTLSFSFKVLDVEHTEITAAPEDGVYVYGLFMDGARWDRDKLTVTDSRPGEMFSPVPVIHFLPKVNYETKPTDYSCPLYKTSVRRGVLSSLGHSTNFVIAVDMPSTKPPDYWVLKGTALLCQLND